MKKIISFLQSSEGKYFLFANLVAIIVAVGSFFLSTQNTLLVSIVPSYVIVFMGFIGLSIRTLIVNFIGKALELGELKYTKTLLVISLSSLTSSGVLFILKQYSTSLSNSLLYIISLITSLVIFAVLLSLIYKFNFKKTLGFAVMERIVSVILVMIFGFVLGIFLTTISVITSPVNKENQDITKTFSQAQDLVSPIEITISDDKLPICIYTTGKQENDVYTQEVKCDFLSEFNIKDDINGKIKIEAEKIHDNVIKAGSAKFSLVFYKDNQLLDIPPVSIPPASFNIYFIAENNIFINYQGGTKYIYLDNKKWIDSLPFNSKEIATKFIFGNPSFELRPILDGVSSKYILFHYDTDNGLSYNNSVYSSLLDTLRYQLLGTYQFLIDRQTGKLSDYSYIKNESGVSKLLLSVLPAKDDVKKLVNYLVTTPEDSIKQEFSSWKVCNNLPSDWINVPVFCPNGWNIEKVTEKISKLDNNASLKLVNASNPKEYIIITSSGESFCESTKYTQCYLKNGLAISIHPSIINYDTLKITHLLYTQWGDFLKNNFNSLYQKKSTSIIWNQKDFSAISTIDIRPLQKITMPLPNGWYTPAPTNYFYGSIKPNSERVILTAFPLENLINRVSITPPHVEVMIVPKENLGHTYESGQEKIINRDYTDQNLHVLANLTIDKEKINQRFSSLGKPEFVGSTWGITYFFFYFDNKYLVFGFSDQWQDINPNFMAEFLNKVIVAPTSLLTVDPNPVPSNEEKFSQLVDELFAKLPSDFPLPKKSEIVMAKPYKIIPGFDEPQRNEINFYTTQNLQYWIDKYENYLTKHNISKQITTGERGESWDFKNPSTSSEFKNIQIYFSNSDRHYDLPGNVVISFW